MRYQKEFDYISETIDKLNVTITNQSETLLILAEDDFYNDNSKGLTLLGHKLSHFWNLNKHHAKNMAFKLELETVFNQVMSKLSQESLTEVESSLLSEQAEMLVPLLEAKQSVSHWIEERSNHLRDAIGSMLSTNGCYDINHLTPYLEEGHMGQKLSLMTILSWLCPDNATHAFPKCGANCSNDGLISPSPTHTAEPSNIISTGTKADLFGEKKAPNSKLSESQKTMTPRYKFKRIKNGGKVQKIQSPGVHKMKFKNPHKIADSQNTPIKSPNISCDSTVLDTGIPKRDSTKMDLEVQDRKQNPMPKKVIETEATTKASTESPNMSPNSNSIETEATTKASTESPNMSPDSNVIETEATSEASTEPNMSPDSNVIETEATSEASTELPNMSPDSNVMETEATSKASTESPNMSPDSNVIETEATSEASTELPNMSPDSNVIETEATSEASTELPNMSPDSNVIETEATSKASTESPNMSPDS